MFSAATKRAVSLSRRLSSKTNHLPSSSLARTVTTASLVAGSEDSKRNAALVAASAAAVTAAAFLAVTTTTQCEDHLTPADVARENFEEVQASHDISKMPIYTSDDVAEMNGEDGKPIWMSYGGVVYDVTKFIPNHPGGSEKIMTAAGSVSRIL